MGNLDGYAENYHFMGGLKYSGWFRDNLMHSYMLKDRAESDFDKNFAGFKEISAQGLQTKKIITRRNVLELNAYLLSQKISQLENKILSFTKGYEDMSKWAEVLAPDST